MANSFAKKIIQKNESQAGEVQIDNNLTSENIQTDVFNNESDKNTLLELRPEQLKRDPTQPRIFFSKDELYSLLKDIEANGQIQAVLIGPKDPVDGLYPIIVGERRWRAISLSENGLKIFAIKLSEKNNPDKLKKLMIQKAENKERVNINILEESISYKRIAEICSESGMKQEEIAKSLGISRTQLVKYLAVANCNSIVDMASQTNITGDLESLYTLSTIYNKSPEYLEDINLLEELKNQDKPLRDFVRSLKKEISLNSDSPKKDKTIVKNRKIKSFDISIISSSEFEFSLNEKLFTVTLEQLNELEEKIKNVRTRTFLN